MGNLPVIRMPENKYKSVNDILEWLYLVFGFQVNLPGHILFASFFIHYFVIFTMRSFFFISFSRQEFSIMNSYSLYKDDGLRFCHRIVPLRSSKVEMVIWSYMFSLFLGDGSSVDYC